MKNIPFEVVVIYENDSPYEPYSLKPSVSVFSRKVYALKVNGEYFTLGGFGDGVYIADLEGGE